MQITRLGDGPIISASTDPSIGHNIQGPSLVRVPDWVKGALGRYYLYFADHKGTYIRMAYADHLVGPWIVHVPGTLQLADSHFLTEPPPATDDEIEFLKAVYTEALGSDQLAEGLAVDATMPHIASPDVHVDEEAQRFVMYFHGLESLGLQSTRVALSSNGLDFRAEPEILGATYMRAFRYDGWTYALTMPGHLSRSRDGISGFEPGPQLFTKHMRHSAVLRHDAELTVFWTQVGDAPEHILASTIDLSGDWMEWTESDPVSVLLPEFDWEGSDRPAEPSRRSVAPGPVNQLRDPAIFQEGGRTYLLYAVAGESGIAIAEIG